jgi:hypothetical protein
MISGIKQFLSHFIPATKSDIHKLEKLIMATAKEQLDALNAQLDKVTAEILAEVKTLEDKLSSQDISPEAQASLDTLKAKVQALDDLNPDVAPPAP